MKNIFFILFLLISLANNAQENKQVKDAIKFQNKLNKEFADKEKSPLTEEDLKTFKELDFFPIDTNFIVVAKLKLIKDSKPFEMKTTTNRLPIYTTYATATFKLKGKEYILNIYQNQKLMQTTDFEDYLFLPFTDKSNGESTYQGGRYLDLEIPKGNTIVINFNKTYNPYCAYNGKYSCPIPPKSNHLDVKIEAGIKAYRKH